MTKLDEMTQHYDHILDWHCSLPDGSVLYRPMPVKDVIVIKEWKKKDCEGLEELAQRTGSLLILLGAGSSLEMLDEDAMRLAGWVRA